MDTTKHRFKIEKGVIAFIVAMGSLIATNDAKSETAEFDIYSVTESEVKTKIEAELSAKYQSEAKIQSETKAFAEYEKMHRLEMKTKSEAIAKAVAQANAEMQVESTNETQVKFEAKKYVEAENNTRTKSKAVPESYALLISDYDIGLITQIVQHEVGNEPEFYPDYDFDAIQQYMARTVVNRLGMNDWNSIEDVITAPGQYCSLEEISEFNANDEITKKNVLAVVNGEDGISNDVLFEMSWPADTPVEDAIASMERQVGPIYDTYVVYANYQNYTRLIIFGYQEKEE